MRAYELVLEGTVGSRSRQTQGRADKEEYDADDEKLMEVLQDFQDKCIYNAK